MALGAALATGKPQAYAVVPGPGLLNSSAALLTAYSMNAPVLALIGEIPDADIGTPSRSPARDPRSGRHHRAAGRSLGAHPPPGGSVAPDREGAARDGDRPARSRGAANARSMCGASAGQTSIAVAAARAAPKIDEDAIRRAAKRLGAAQAADDPLRRRRAGRIGGSHRNYRRCCRRPCSAIAADAACSTAAIRLSVTLPLGRDLWGEADVVLGGRHPHADPAPAMGHRPTTSTVIRVDADKDEPARLHKPAVALIGDAEPILERLIDVLPRTTPSAPRARDEMQERQAEVARRACEAIGPQIGFLDAIRDELPEDGIFVDEVTQIGFAARLAFPVYKPRTFLSPGYQDNLGWGFATALGAQDARRDVPVVSISGDGGFMYTANELATAVRHRIPLTAIVFADGAFGNVRRIQQENFGNRVIASDLANPDFVQFAESFGAAAERARTPEELRAALRRAFARRDGPTLIEVPVGPFPSPWPFLHMPRNRGV